MSGTRLAPNANKFHAGAGADGKHYWLTPPKLYAELDAQYSFDFDPCPYPKPDDFDGLTAEWGASNYVNPPFGSILHDGKRKGMTAWVRKALAEHAKGKRVVMVYPLDKWVLMLLAAGAKVTNLGDVRWHATEDGSEGKGTGRHIACFTLDQAGRSPAEVPPNWPEEVQEAQKDYAAKLDRMIVCCEVLEEVEETEGLDAETIQNARDNALFATAEHQRTLDVLLAAVWRSAQQ